MLLALLFTLGCGGCATKEARPDAHYVQAEGIFAAVAAGDLVLAQALGQEMDGSALQPPPAHTLEHLDRVHSGLAFLSVAEDRLEGAQALAGMAKGCGGCHAQLGVAAGQPGEGVTGAWTALWRGDFEGSLAASQACASARGVALEHAHPDTAEELDAAGAFALLVAKGSACAPSGAVRP